MREAMWRSGGCLPLEDEHSTDLVPLYIQWLSKRRTLLTLSEIWVVRDGVQLKWHGATADLNTAMYGTWITCKQDTYADLLEWGYVPLTQGMLCADNCSPLMEILYHEHEVLLRLLDSF